MHHLKNEILIHFGFCGPIKILYRIGYTLEFFLIHLILLNNQGLFYFFWFFSIGIIFSVFQDWKITGNGLGYGGRKLYGKNLAETYHLHLVLLNHFPLEESSPSIL